MLNVLVISRYNFWIIGLYVILLPLFLLFTPGVLRYDLQISKPGQTQLIVFCTVLGFYLLNRLFNFRKVKSPSANFSQIAVVIAYAFVFAVAEEIIFRGIIQSAVMNFLENLFMAVIASSAIFALAHLPNDATGLHPRNWNWQLVAITFLAGLPLGLIFAITQSLFIPTILHACFLIFYKLFTADI